MAKTPKFNVPNYEIESLARLLLPSIQKFYESEEGQKEFADWKKKQDIKDKPMKHK